MIFLLIPATMPFWAVIVWLVAFKVSKDRAQRNAWLLRQRYQRAEWEQHQRWLVEQERRRWAAHMAAQDRQWNAQMHALRQVHAPRLTAAQSHPQISKSN